MPRHDVMIDIETLGTGTDAVVLTIGAMEFCLTDQEFTVHSKKLITINPRSAQQAGMTIDADTILWWMKQSEEARAALTSPLAVSLQLAMERLTEYIVSIRAKNTRQQLNVWGNDPDFDMVRLESAYRMAGQLAPWKYYETRSTRTMLMLAEDILGLTKRKDFVREGTHHAADDDAVYQAAMVHTIYKKLQNS